MRVLCAKRLGTCGRKLGRRPCAPVQAHGPARGANPLGARQQQCRSHLRIKGADCPTSMAAQPCSGWPIPARLPVLVPSRPDAVTKPKQRCFCHRGFVWCLRTGQTRSCSIIRPFCHAWRSAALMKLTASINALPLRQRCQIKNIWPLF